MAEDHEHDPTAALLGEPTGEETLSRERVDDLEISTKQPKRPDGMSRADYMRRSGSDTGQFVVLAGVSPGRRIAMVVLTCALLAAAGALVWFLVLRS